MFLYAYERGGPEKKARSREAEESNRFPGETAPPTHPLWPPFTLLPTPELLLSEENVQ